MGKRSLYFAAGALVAALLSAPAAATPLVFFETVTNTDFTAVGIGGLRNGSGTATLNLSGVTGPVSKAYLYWHGPTDVVDSTDANANIKFANQAITGTFIGVSNDNCWEFANSIAYRADVTSLVTGNGNYSLANFIKPGVQINGFSLIVFYDDRNSANNRDVMLFNANDSNERNVHDNDGWNITLANIDYAGSTTVNAQFHVSDGQTFSDAALIANDTTTLAPEGAIFQGALAQDGGSGFPDNGLLWDIATFNITSLLSPGLNTLNITTGVNEDCISCVLVAIDLPTRATPPPNGVPEPGSLALLGGGLLAGLGARRIRRK